MIERGPAQRQRHGLRFAGGGLSRRLTQPLGLSLLQIVGHSVGIHHQHVARPDGDSLFAGRDFFKDPYGQMSAGQLGRLSA